MFRTDLGDLWRFSIISDWCACTPPSSRPELDLENVKAYAKRSATDRGCWSVIFRLASAPGCPIRPRAVVALDVRVAEEVLQDEPRAGRPFADSSGFTDLARIHKYHEINAYHASNGFEGPRVHDPACPQKDATPPEGLQGRRRQL